MVARPEAIEDLPPDRDKRLWALLKEEPNIAARLTKATSVFPARQVTAYSRKVRKLYGPGFALLGNAGDFIDPIFSSGVTIALQSSRLAVAALVPQLRGESVDWEEQYATPLSKGVEVFRVFVESWYQQTTTGALLLSGQDRRPHPEDLLDSRWLCLGPKESICSPATKATSNPPRADQ